MNVARVCRLLAIAMIVAGVIDPGVTATRAIKPVVSVIDTSDDARPASGAAGPGRSAALADRVATALGSRNVVVRTLSPDASAVVAVGDGLTPFAERVAVPAFAVRPAGPVVSIVALDVPPRAHVDARAPIAASIHALHARGLPLVATLESNGAVVDRVTRAIDSDDARLAVPLTLTPSAAGVASLRVTVSVGERAPAAVADSLVRIDARPWSVLVFDRRPSWMSTFVRRALEADARFVVTSRTATSTNVSTDTPNAPITLNDLAGLARFDAIVAGAPDALTPADVAALDAFMRRRGGSVVLPWDAPPTGPAAAVGGVTRWNRDDLATDAAIATFAGELRASELAWPALLPPRAQTLAVRPSIGSPVDGAAIWSTPVGPGRVVVSGALDSWRYRSAPQAAFDRVWPAIVADAADLAPPPVRVRVDRRVVRPGDAIVIDIRSRDAGGEYADSAIPATRASARLTGAAGATVADLRVWPGSAPGTYTATIAAPATPGDYHVIASIAPDRNPAAVTEGDADVRVQADVRSLSTGDALESWTSSRGGAVYDETHLDALDAAIARTRTPAARANTVHPMRSAWWIAPITLLTSIEWWTRRRRGLR